MYHLKTEKQMNNTRSARTPTLPELLASNKNSLQLPQPQVNNQATPGKATTTLGHKHTQLQPALSHAKKAMNLMRIACVLETSRGTLSGMASKSTTLLKPTWEPLLLR
jgi:hypothetical protein